MDSLVGLPADRKRQVLHAEVGAQRAALGTPAGWQAWLAVAGRFPHYSLHNQLLLVAQLPHASAVQPLRNWNLLGRHMVKGQRQLWLLAEQVTWVPTTIDADRGGLELDREGTHTRHVSGHMPVAVVDVTQTSGAPLPAAPTPPTAADSWQALARSYGLRVQRSNDQALLGAAAVTDQAGGSIIVRADLDEPATLGAVIGEVVRLHTPAATTSDVARQSGLSHDDVARFEADSVTYLVSTALGLAVTPPAVPDLTGIDQDTLTMLAERVRVAACAVLNAVQPTPDLPVTLDDAVRQATRRAEALAQGAEELRARGQAQEAVIDATFPQAVAAHKTGGHLRELAAVNRAAWDWFQTQAGSSPQVAAAVAARGLDLSDVQAVGIGWAPPEWRSLYRHLSALGFRQEVIEAAGLVRTARNGKPIDAFRGRVMFAYIDGAGLVRGFTGRATGPQREGTPKYVNSGATDLFQKRRLLLGVEQIRGHTDTVVLVEGPWDALAITLATNQRAVGVASNGTALSAEHAQHLSAQGRQVVVWTDADDAGRRAARDALDTLTQGGVPVPRYVEVHDLDPSDYQRLFGPAAIRAALLASDPLVCVLADYRLAAVADSGLFAQIEEIRRLGVYTAELGQGDRNLLAGLIQQHTTLAIDSVLAALNEAEPRSLGKALAVARPHPSTSRDSHIAATTRQRLPRLSP